MMNCFNPFLTCVGLSVVPGLGSCGKAPDKSESEVPLADSSLNYESRYRVVELPNGPNEVILDIRLLLTGQVPADVRQ